MASPSRPFGDPPNLIGLIYEGLEDQQSRSNDFMNTLGMVIEEHTRLERDLADLRQDVHNNKLYQDERMSRHDVQIGDLYAQIGLMREALNSGRGVPIGPASGSAPMSPVGNVSSTTTTQTRVSCSMCGIILAKSSLKKHMNKSCPNRPIPIRSDPTLPASASGPMSPSGNVSFTTKNQIRVSCPMCGKDLAKGSLKNHMKKACPNRPIPVLT